MGMKHLATCEVCGETGIRYKHTKKVRGKRMCRKCYRENLGYRKDETRAINHAPKNAHKTFNPLIKKNGKKIPGLGLTSEEGKALYNLLIKRGMDEEKAKERLRDLKRFEKKLQIDLRNEPKRKIEINKKFKDKFRRLVKNASS